LRRRIVEPLKARKARKKRRQFILEENESSGYVYGKFNCGKYNEAGNIYVFD